jgi:hypothetical protein
VVEARLTDDVTEDREGEVALQLVILGVRQHRDADSELRSPPQVGQESVTPAAVIEEIRPLAPEIPAMNAHAERVPGTGAGMRCRDGPHLRHRLWVEDDATVERAAGELEAQEPAEVRGARVHPAGCRHRLVERRDRERLRMANRPVVCGSDRAAVERGPAHAERPEQRIAHDGRKWLVLEPLQDVPGEVDPEVRVRVGGPNRVTQPGLGDASHMCVELAGVELVVVADRRLEGQPRRMAQQHPKGDLPLRMLFERAVDGELGQVRRDRRIQVHPAGGDGLHDRGGGE